MESHEFTLQGGSVVKATDDQVSSTLADEEVILNLKNGSYYGLDPTGAHIWSLIQQPMTFDELIDKLLKEFDVSRDRCVNDVAELLHDLHDHELIEVRQPA